MQTHSNDAPSARQPPSDKNIFRRHIWRLQDAGNWFLCFRGFFKILKKLDALFLQDLMNRAASAEDKYRSNDGYFMCTNEFLSKDWSEREQETRFAALVRAGYIKLERRGMPSRRWVWIDLDRIISNLDEAQYAESHLPQNRGECPPLNGGGNKEYPTGIPESVNKGVPAQRSAAAGVPQVPLNKPKQSRTKGDDDVPFFVVNSAPSTRDKPRTAQQRVSDVDLSRASRLRRYAKDHKYPSSKSPKRWAQAMRILREQGAPDIDSVLDWLIATNPPRPTISDAHQFRLCFNWLTDLWNKDRPRAAMAAQPISDSAKDIARRLRTYGWPANDFELESAIQMSLDGLRSFLAKCEQLAARPKHEMKDLVLINFAKMIVSGGVCVPGTEPDFVFNWFDHIATWLRTHLPFRGSLFKFVISINNERFHETGRKVASEYDGGNTQLWDRLVRAINELK